LVNRTADERWVMTGDVPGSPLTRANWRKSSYSGKEGNCVEIALLPGDTAAVRDSTDPRGPALVHPATRLAALVAAAKAGDLDGRHA
jgi:uncharacterized protein DUF397